MWEGLATKYSRCHEATSPGIFLNIIDPIAKNVREPRRILETFYLASTN
jgi:hypothetical protein